MTDDGYCFCHHCLEERRFIGALSNVQISGLDLPLFFLRSFFFRPVCIECGETVNSRLSAVFRWGKREFEAHELDAKDPYNSPMQIISRKNDKGDSTTVQAFNLSGQKRIAEQKSESVCSKEYKFLSHVCSVEDESGQPLSHFVTELTYTMGSMKVRDESAILVWGQHFRSRCENLELYGDLGSGTNREGSKKLKLVAKISLTKDARGKMLRSLRFGTMAFFASNKQIVILDFEDRLASKTWHISDILGYCSEAPSIEATHVCVDERSALIVYKEYIEQEFVYGIAAINFGRDGGLHKLAECGAQKPICDSGGHYMFYACGNIAYVHASGNWNEHVAYRANGQIVGGKISTDCSKLILQVRDPDFENSDGAIYEVWQMPELAQASNDAAAGTI